MKNLDEVNVACVLWGTSYSNEHAISLYEQVCKHMTLPVCFHVYTESDRLVDPRFIHHALPELSAPNGWWYKTVLFDSSMYAGPLLYLDLDVVISGDLTWITKLDYKHMWGIRDFRKLWDPSWNGFNSSVLWFDTKRFNRLWQDFTPEVMTKLRGDQDWLNTRISETERRFFPEESMVSWRWQCKDGGWNHRARVHNRPGSGTNTLGASVLVFHGEPKPWEVDCPVIRGLRCQT